MSAVRKMNLASPSGTGGAKSLGETLELEDSFVN